MTNNLRRWLAFAAAMLGGFGLFALVAPSVMGALYGGETNEHGLLWARYYGSAVLFGAYVAWFARGMQELRTLRSMALALLLFFSVNLGVSLYAVAFDLLNAWHWTTIAGQALMVTVWGYYRFVALRPPAAEVSAPVPEGVSR